MLAGGISAAKRIAKAFMILGVLLTITSSAMSLITLVTGVGSVVDLSTFDCVIRTGGTLHEPNSEDDSYPLTYSMSDPGNRSIAEIPDFTLFAIFSQMLVGTGLLENGSDTGDPAWPMENARYDMLLNLTTSIQIDTPEEQTVKQLDRIVNLYMNESTAQHAIITKEVAISVVDEGSGVEVHYYLTRTPNNDSSRVSEVILTPASVAVQLVETMNVSLVSDWTACFTSPGASSVTYMGNGTVAAFRIDRNPDSTCTLNGLFRCYYSSQHVSVFAEWTPELGVVGATVGVIITLVSFVYLRRSPVTRVHGEESGPNTSV